MKKTLAFILLLGHVNFAMFIAQVDESDALDRNGQQLEDINSLVQYIDVIVLKHVHQNTKDSDDDNARYFHVAEFDNYSFPPIEIVKEHLFAGTTKFPPYTDNKLSSLSLEIQGPPPKA